jgi:tetraacyldisaccharide-1-P 4'-kinase
MVNGLAPWGNSHFIPRGPMREPLSALGRADIVVIHNADMVCGNRGIAISYLVSLYSLLL